MALVDIASITKERAAELVRTLRAAPVAPRKLMGMNVYLDATMIEEQREEVEVPRTFAERWIEPLKHGATLPFEPWVKTKWVETVNIVPSLRVVVLPGALVMHPRAFAQVEAVMLERGGYMHPPTKEVLQWQKG